MGLIHTWWRGRAARHRPAKPFTRVRIPSPPRLTTEYACTGAIGAAVARFPDTEEVTGSIPVSPTNKVESWFARAFLFNLSSMIRVAE